MFDFSSVFQGHKLHQQTTTQGSLWTKVSRRSNKTITEANFSFHCLVSLDLVPEFSVFLQISLGMPIIVGDFSNTMQCTQRVIYSSKQYLSLFKLGFLKSRRCWLSAVVPVTSLLLSLTLSSLHSNHMGFLEHILVLTLGPSICFLCLNSLPTDMYLANSLTSFKCLLKFYLLNEANVDHLT